MGMCGYNASESSLSKPTSFVRDILKHKVIITFEVILIKQLQDLDITS